MTNRISIPLRAFPILLFLAAVAAAQDAVLGHAIGRVLDAQGRPLSDCEVEVVQRRGPRDVVVARDRSGFDGRYDLKTGALAGRARLRLRHARFAPREHDLKPLVSGAGLLLPDLALDEGRLVTVTAIPPFELPRGTLRLDVFPLRDDERLIDVDGAPIASAIMTEGRASLRLPDGLLAFVVGDLRTRVAPELLVWKVGEGCEVLPPLSLQVGGTARFRVASPGDGDLLGDLVIGSGCWHPDGGGEYRLRLRVGGKVEAAKRAELRIEHLPTGAFRLDLESGRHRASAEGLPGDAERLLELRPGCRLRGSVRLGGSLEAVSGARVFVADRVAVTDDDGEFVVTGLLPGAHAVTVAKPGLVGGERGRILFADFDQERRLDLTVEPGARASGTARDLDLEPLPGALVSVRPEGAGDRGLGRYLQARTDEKGDFLLTGLPAGLLRFGLVSPGGAVSLDDVFEVEVNAVVVARPRLGVAGFGSGRLKDARGEPLAGARLWFVSAPAPLAWRRGHDLVPATDEIVAVPARTDEEGRYGFVDLAPGLYDRILVRRDAAPELLPAISVEAGSNETGMDWQAGPGAALLLDLPEMVMLRLRSESDPELDCWLWRPAGAPVTRLDGLPSGRYRVERLRGGVSRFAEPELPYHERRADRAFARFSHPSLDPVVVPAPEGVAFAPLRLHLLVQGDPPGERRIEITAYALAGSWPLRPLRIEAPLDGRIVDLELPRGVYLFQGRIPGLAEGWAGPITLGTGFDERGASELVLDLAGRSDLVGRIALQEGAGLGDELMQARIARPEAAAIRPFRAPEAAAAVEANGFFRIADAPSGPVVLRLVGEELEIERDLDLQPYRTIDLGELVPVAASQPRLRLDARAEIGARVEDRRGPVAMNGRWRRLTGAFLAAIELEGQAGPATRRAVRLAMVDEVPALLDRETLQGRGRAALRFRLQVDRERLRDWPVELLAIAGDARDFDRPGFELQSDGDGEVVADLLPAGDYALRFDYGDEEGRSYRMALPLRLADTTAPARPLATVETRPLEVILRRESDGRAVVGAMVRLKRTDLRGLEHKSVFRREIAVVSEGLSDEDGQIRFEKMPLGHYDVEVTAPGLVRGRLLGLDLSQTGPRRVVRVDLAAGRRLELRIVGEGRRPLEGMRVFLGDDQGLPVHDDRLLLTDPDGRLELADLPEGPLEIRARGPGFPAQVLGRVQPDHGRRVFEELEARPGARLVVTCRDGGGRPLPGARIELADEQGLVLVGPEADPLDESPAAVSPGGSRRLGLLSAGLCRVRALKEGFQPAERTIELRPGEETRIELELEKSP